LNLLMKKIHMEKFWRLVLFLQHEQRHR